MPYNINKDGSKTYVTFSQLPVRAKIDYICAIPKVSVSAFWKHKTHFFICSLKVIYPLLIISTTIATCFYAFKVISKELNKGLKLNEISIPPKHIVGLVLCVIALSVLIGLFIDYIKHRIGRYTEARLSPEIDEINESIHMTIKQDGKEIEVSKMSLLLQNNMQLNQKIDQLTKTVGQLQTSILKLQNDGGQKPKESQEIS